MFNLQTITAAVRFCVIGVLLFAPLTSRALPTFDDHVALGSERSAAPPNTQEVCPPLAGPSGSVAFHNSECERGCLRVFDECNATCDGSKWCAIACSLSHAFCTYGCNIGGP